MMEIKRLLTSHSICLKKFGFEEFEVYLSTRPEKSVGSDDNWKHATDALESALKDKGIKI